MKHVAALLVPLLAAACSSPDKPAEQPTTPPPAPRVAAPAAAAPDTARQRFSWDDEVCTNTGYFPAGQYTQSQLRDSHTLVAFPYASAQYQESIWELAQFHPDSINTRLDRLEQEHRRELAAVRALRVVPRPYWQQLQQLRLGEIEEFYQLRKRTLQAYFNPQLLLTAPRAKSCRRYVQALTTADTLQLLQAWREQVTESKKDNGAPEHLETRYQSRYNSPDRLRYARLELMLYGWWNCANAERQYVDLDAQQQPATAFEQLFSKVVRSDCDDVD